MVHATELGASAHAPAALPGPVLAGVGLVATATLAWLASRGPGHRQIWFAAAAGALLIIAGAAPAPRCMGRRPRRAGLAAPCAARRSRRVHRCEPRPPRWVRLPGTHGPRQRRGNRSRAGRTPLPRRLRRLAGRARGRRSGGVHAFGEGVATAALLGALSERHLGREGSHGGSALGFG